MCSFPQACRVQLWFSITPLCYSLERTRVSSSGPHVPYSLHVPLRALALDVETRVILDC
jgi:hypothetical protein